MTNTLKTGFARSIALFAGIHLLGGHWLALQLVAWIGMFSVNSQDVPLATALEKTFAGKHPCPLCHAVESGQEQERDNTLIDTGNKVNAVMVAALNLPPRPESNLIFFPETATPHSVTFAPRSLPPWRG